MSFSVTIQAPTRAEAVSLATQALSAQMENQPAHAHDKGAILAAVKAFADAVEDSATQDTNITCYGHADGWWAENVFQHLNGTSMTIKVWLSTRKVQEPVPTPEPAVAADPAPAQTAQVEMPLDAPAATPTDIGPGTAVI